MLSIYFAKKNEYMNSFVTFFSCSHYRFNMYMVLGQYNTDSAIMRNYNAYICIYYEATK